MFDSIRTIPVRVRPPYDVRIGSGLLGRCGDYLAALLGQRRIAVLADDTVASLYLDTVTAALEDAGFAVCSHIFPSGEGRKNLSTLTELLEFLASEHLTRTDCVAALGGGVTGDMAGFAAAVYLRGIRYVQLPTTLLAAVDSSVGGKTAVDLTAGKNLAGAFCQPAAVICDTDCLKTLPPDVFADPHRRPRRGHRPVRRLQGRRGGAGREGAGGAEAFEPGPYCGPRHREVQRLCYPPWPRRGGGAGRHRPGCGGPGLDGGVPGGANHRLPF